MIERLEEATNAYFAGRCDAFSQDQSTLAAVRARAPNPADHVVLPEVISKAPFGPGVMPNDLRWMEIVRWSVYAHDQRRGARAQLDDDRCRAGQRRSDVCNASSARPVASARCSASMPSWAFRIVKQVGNYAESFDRNIKPLGIERGLNRLWKDGGRPLRPRPALSPCLELRRTRRVWPALSQERPGRGRSSGRLAVVAVAAMLATVAVQTAENLRRRGIASGFDYPAAARQDSRSPAVRCRISSRDTYARALAGRPAQHAAGLVRSALLIASVLGCRSASRASRGSGSSSTLASAYVEVLRNTPLLLQLFFWYTLSQALPAPPRGAEPGAGRLLCFRGLFLPAPRLASTACRALALESPDARRLRVSAAAPRSRRSSPRSLIGLSTYTAAFIGEIVRGGILAVGQGQTEAAAALGLSRRARFGWSCSRRRCAVIIPPATSQFLNLVKNSSLAVAIGYPDLISVTNTTLNQTGQAIEAMTLAMIVYLAISLTISLA